MEPIKLEIAIPYIQVIRTNEEMALNTHEVLAETYNEFEPVYKQITCTLNEPYRIEVEI